jgi:hypothetical protein
MSEPTEVDAIREAYHDDPLVSNEQYGRMVEDAHEAHVAKLEAGEPETGEPEPAKDIALRVKAAAIVKLDEREHEFKRDMLVGASVNVRKDITLEQARTLYDRHYDDVWLADDGLDADNDRHEADDYYEGYVAGASMVLVLLHEAFGIEPPADEGGDTDGS